MTGNTKRRREKRKGNGSAKGSANESANERGSANGSANESANEKCENGRERGQVNTSAEVLHSSLRGPLVGFGDIEFVKKDPTLFPKYCGLAFLNFPLKNSSFLYCMCLIYIKRHFQISHLLLLEYA